VSADGLRTGAEAPALSGAATVLAGAALLLRPAGTVFWPEESLLAVADLHLGRAERLAREGGALLPPYETIDTLDRLEAEVAAIGPRRVVCLGDSFDDADAARDLADEMTARIDRLAAGREWIWVGGNHDPGPLDLPGTHRAGLEIGPLAFRHIAAPADPTAGEVSAHFHPKARLVRRGVAVSRPCFLADARRLILPAFGTYTGGLDARDPAFEALLGRDAVAWLTGREVLAIPRARLG